MEAVVTSSAAACIRCIAVDPAGKRIAVSSECVIFLLCGRVIFIDLVSEATIKLIDLEDTVNISILHGHNDVVRKVTWEPSGNILVCYPALQINAGRLHLSIDLLQCRWKNYCMGSYARTETAQTYRRHHPCCQGQGVRRSQPTTSNVV